MALSVAKRLEGRTDEALEYRRLWGDWKAMEKYGVKDYLAWTKFVEENAKTKDLKINTLLGRRSDSNLAEDLVDAFTARLLKLETEKQRLADELAEAKRLLSYHEHQAKLAIEPKISTFIEMCERG